MEVLARPLFKLTSTITPSKTCHTHFNNKSILLLPQLSAFSTFTFSASSRSLSPVKPVRHATPESQLSSDTREWVMQGFECDEKENYCEHRDAFDSSDKPLARS
ncbi:hypothetical protein Patl1_23976 [Pistacia atlantica]|uniref:Uncharacterized protein n=1 Tax=Pistacia atlantica TaxID=434234 RepID=A0ACC0ZUH9_9ROSI|nr:hypothetical protein Patl1_23976 [Pistacia atlantica]